VTFELTPVAKDALVFIVNVKNPMKSRTEEQLVKLYGEEFKWRDRDEARRSGKLTPYARERDSGSRELFDALVMKGRPSPKNEPPELIAGSMGGPYNQVTQDESGIGYSVYYYEHFMAASPLTRAIAVNGVEPTAETIASGKYPYVTPVYAIRRGGEPEDSAASRLLKWLLSDEGQAVVRESGYVPAR
jgi:ABC-type phosphate transport system substrate-binding protein